MRAIEIQYIADALFDIIGDETIPLAPRKAAEKIVSYAPKGNWLNFEF